jgi:hypothetical protein
MKRGTGGRARILVFDRNAVYRTGLWSNKEIARVLDIAEATTKIHVAALLRVLSVRNHTEAAVKAWNLIALTEVSAAPSIAADDEQIASTSELTSVGSMSWIDD